MVNVTNQQTTKQIGTVGYVGRERIAGMVLPTVDIETGEKGQAWFTFETIDEMGFLHWPLSLIEVPVESVEIVIAK